MGGWRRPYGAGLLFLASALAGCAHSEQNYLEPGVPIYSESHGLAPAPRDSIRVVTFNIEFALHVPQAIEGLRAQPALRDFDVLLLQEMDAQGVDAVARALSANCVYYPSSRSPKTHRDIGTAILSPWPIEAATKVQLPHLSRITRNARAVAGADVLVGDRRVRVYSVHFGTPLGLGPQQRRDQLDAVLADAALRDDAVIIGGDFNSKGLAGQVAQRGFAWPTRDLGHTRWIFSIDHILARGLQPVGTPSAGVAREVKGASDHYPVWATFAAR